MKRFEPKEICGLVVVVGEPMLAGVRWGQRNLHRHARPLRPQAAVCLEYLIQYSYWKVIWKNARYWLGKALTTDAPFSIAAEAVANYLKTRTQSSTDVKARILVSFEEVEWVESL